MLRRQKLRGKVAVVTGAASGIGAACALELAKRGAHVAVTDLSAEGAETVAKDCRALGVRAIGVRCDVRDESELRDAQAQVEAQLGAAELVIANAGVGIFGPADRIPWTDWTWVLDVNLIGVIQTLRVFGPGMVERGAGHVIVNASGGGLIAIPTETPYAVSKFGAVGLAEGLAAEWRHRGVDVSIVCASFVHTGIARGERLTPAQGETLEEAKAARAARVKQLFRGAMAPARAAERILDGVERRRLYIFPHRWVRALWIVKALFPDLMVRILSARDQLLDRASHRAAAQAKQAEPGRGAAS